jgi:SAM-dependent methyltransferase
LARTKTKSGDWYDYPQYYDLAFAEETPVEADFIEAACKKFAVGRVTRMLEPGCGGGRLVVELARRGYRTVGFDNNRQSIAYLERRIARSKLKAEALLGDMTDFQFDRPFDAVFNTFNTFRHLMTERAALAHLRCVANALRPGGLFILGFHLLPPDASEDCTERWRASQGKTRVSFTLRITVCDRRDRWEMFRVMMLVRRGDEELRLATEFPMRLYTAGQFRSLLRKVPEFELCEVFDFGYEIDVPVRFDDWLSDAVFILRKR